MKQNKRLYYHLYCRLTGHFVLMFLVTKIQEIHIYLFISCLVHNKHLFSQWLLADLIESENGGRG